jgi:hypothetical protein
MTDKQIKTHRIGAFKLDREILRTDWRLGLAIFSQMLILHAEQRYDTDTIDYVALSDLFAEVPIGTRAPEYLIGTCATDEGVTVTAMSV